MNIRLFGIVFIPSKDCEWSLWNADGSNLRQSGFNPAITTKHFVYTLYLLDLSQNKWT